MQFCISNYHSQRLSSTESQMSEETDVTMVAIRFDCQVISGRCSSCTPQQWPLSSTDVAKMKTCGYCGSPLEAINGKWNEAVVKLTPIHTCVVEVHTSRLREGDTAAQTKRYQQRTRPGFHY